MTESENTTIKQLSNRFREKQYPTYKERVINMKTKGENIMKQFLFTAKFGMLVLAMFAILCIPHIVLAAHGQAHSSHFHPYSHAMGYLVEKENKAREKVENTAKKTAPDT